MDVMECISSRVLLNQNSTSPLWTALLWDMLVVTMEMFVQYRTSTKFQVTVFADYLSSIKIQSSKVVTANSESG